MRAMREMSDARCKSYATACMTKLTTLTTVNQPPNSTKILNSRSLELHTRGIKASLTMLVILREAKRENGESEPISDQSCTHTREAASLLILFSTD